MGEKVATFNPSIKFLIKLKGDIVHYYFKNVLYRNVHIYTHDLCDEKCTSEKGIYIIAFQTNYSNSWYYLNAKATILDDMRFATKAARFEDAKTAYDYMQRYLIDLEFQGVEKIEA